METMLTICLLAATGYLLMGIVFGVLFIISGITRVDAAAKGSSKGFRLIILPGVILLWPWLLRKWILSLRK